MNANDCEMVWFKVWLSHCFFVSPFIMFFGFSLVQMLRYIFCSCVFVLINMPFVLRIIHNIYPCISLSCQCHLPFLSAGRLCLMVGNLLRSSPIYVASCILCQPTWLRRFLETRVSVANLVKVDCPGQSTLHWCTVCWGSWQQCDWLTPCNRIPQEWISGHEIFIFCIVQQTQSWLGFFQAEHL